MTDKLNEITMEKIKEAVKWMVNTPNDTPAYPLAVSHIRYLIERVEKLEKDMVDYYFKDELDLQKENESLKAKVEELEKNTVDGVLKESTYVSKLKEENEKLRKIVEVAKKVRSGLNISVVPVMVDGLYRTPAQKLREQAQEIEDQDNALREFDTALKQLEGGL